MNLYVPWLADAARSTGHRVVEVGGWRTRGHGAMRLVEGVVGHHTATSDSAPGDYPSLGIVTNGRSDLAGPLCNLGLGRDGTIYVVAAGCAWHAGASAWAGFTDLNDEFLGIEAESAGTGKWSAAQLDCYPKLVGALLKYMSRGTGRYAGHKDVCVPHGRKIDPVGVDTTWLRGQADRFMTGGGGGGAASGSEKFTPDGDEALMIKTFPNGTKEIVGYRTVMGTDGKPERNAGGELTGRTEAVWETKLKVFTFTLPVGKTSAIVSDSWISVKGAGGGQIEYVRLMSIRNQAQYGMPGGGYPQDVEFKGDTAIDSDKDRASIKASDGQDSYTVMVKSDIPFSICIENMMRPVG
jgi:N-acetylmuramoyl-L-alanine amidase